MVVYVVYVHGREDGIYVFANSEDAEQFSEIICRYRGPYAAYVTDEPVSDDDDAQALIEAERASWEDDA